jgi:hypothetical protein
LRSALLQRTVRLSWSPPRTSFLAEKK